MPNTCASSSRDSKSFAIALEDFSSSEGAVLVKLENQSRLTRSQSIFASFDFLLLPLLSFLMVSFYRREAEDHCIEASLLYYIE